MKEFDYELDYKKLDFTDPETRKLYRIGRGEQGVLLVRPYTNDICTHWRFVDEPTARKSADTIYQMFCRFKEQRDFIGMDMARKFLEMVLRERVVMLIIPVEGSTIKCLVKSDPKSQIGEQIRKQRVLQFLRKCEIWHCIRPYIQRDEKRVAFQ